MQRNEEKLQINSEISDHFHHCLLIHATLLDLFEEMKKNQKPQLSYPFKTIDRLMKHSIYALYASKFYRDLEIIGGQDKFIEVFSGLSANRNNIYNANVIENHILPRLKKFREELVEDFLRVANAVKADARRFAPEDFLLAQKIIYNDFNLGNIPAFEYLPLVWGDNLASTFSSLDLNVIDADGNTLLHMLCSIKTTSGLTNVISQCLRCFTIIPNFKNHNNETPFQCLLNGEFHSNIGTIALMLGKHGADISLRNRNGHNLLDVLILHNQDGLFRNEIDILKSQFNLKESNNNMQPPLYFEFYNYMLNIKKCSHEKADLISLKMLSIFMRGNHHITTVSYNIRDGIGDFSGQMFYAEKLNKIIGNLDNVILEHISFITPEKLNIAKFIIKGKLPGYAVYPITQNQIEKDDYDIYITTKSPPAKERNDLYSQADILFNISTNFNDTELKRREILPNSLPPQKSCLINSLREYTLIHTSGAHSRNQNMPIYSEYHTGMRQDQFGMRFALDVVNAGKRENENFYLLSDNIKEKLLGLNPTQAEINEYLLKNTFSIAYIKSKTAAINFITLTLHRSGDVNLLIDANIIREIQSDSYFLSVLKKAGISKIEINENNTVNTVDVLPENKNVLRIFNLNFNDISEQDKICFYGLAKYIAGSGDSSASEVISSGLRNSDSRGLPFFENPASKPIIIRCLLHGLDELCEKSTSSHSELRKYLNLLDDNTLLDSDKIQFIFYNKKQIINSWGDLCNFLYKERNEDIRFKELLVTYIFHYLIKENHIEEFTDLAKSLGPEILPHESLLQLAVQLGNVEAVNAIIDSNLAKFSNHNFNNYSPFHIAVYNGDLTMLKLLHHKFSDTIGKYLQDNTLLKLAEKKELSDITIYLKQLKIDETDHNRLFSLDVNPQPKVKSQPFNETTRRPESK